MKLPFVPSVDARPRHIRDMPAPPNFSPQDAPSIPTLAGPEADPEDYRAYAAVTFDSREMNLTGSGLRRTRTVEARGDHLYVAEVSGYSPVYVRVGPKTNPFMRLETGMVVKRPFRSVTFGIGDIINEVVTRQTVFSRVLAYASMGELVVPPARNYGWSQPFFLQGTATTTPIDLFRQISLTDPFHPTLGKRGGSVIVRNLDMVNTLWLNYLGGFLVTPMDPENTGAFPIYAGQALSFPLDGAISQRRFDDRGGLLMVGTQSGTCKFAVIGSRGETDMFEGTEVDSPYSLS